MAKKRTTEEPEETISEEEQEEKETGGKKQGKTIELDMTMNPAERLRVEMEALAENDQMRLVAKKLLDEFNKDQNLSRAYFDRKVTLDAVIKYITSEARKAAVNNCAMIDDQTVYGWAIHFVQDGEVKPSKKKPTITVIPKETEEQLRKQAEEAFLEAERQRLEAERKKAEERERKKKEAAIAKAEKKRQESGQMSLFEFFEDASGGTA